MWFQQAKPRFPPPPIKKNIKTKKNKSLNAQVSFLWIIIRELYAQITLPLDYEYAELYHH